MRTKQANTNTNVITNTNQKTNTDSTVMDKKTFSTIILFWGEKSFGISYNNDHDLNPDHGDRASGR